MILIKILWCQVVFHKERKGGTLFMGGRGVRGELFCLFILYCVFWSGSRFRGGGKGSDEEHITYSGGKEIFDLLRCGWGEKKMKKKKEESVIKYKMW